MASCKIDVVGLHEKSLQDIAKALETQGYFVRLFTDAPSFLKEFTSYPSDLVILNIDMGEVDGLAVLRRIRGMEDDKRDTRILMIGLDTPSERKCEAYDSGTDGFIDGSSPMMELVAITNALIRRVLKRKEVIHFGPFSLDRLDRIARKNDTVLNLTNCEFLIYQELMEAEGKVLSREALYKTFGDPHKPYDPKSKALDMHIKSLRRKLGDDERHIRSVYGGGYKLVE